MSVYEELDEQKQFACRVIADHARATAFLIADGVLPGNEGRNYVLRKIMRRAIYQGRHALGFKEQFFYKVTDFVIDQMREPYPELEAQREFIARMVRLEEERFGSTMTVGLQKLEELFVKTPKGEIPSYSELARLYDTFGTPRDLIRVSLEQHGFQLEEDTFNTLFESAMHDLQRNALKNDTRGQGRETRSYPQVLLNRWKTKFVGYDKTEYPDCPIITILKGNTEVTKLGEGEEGELVLSVTPFYAESGGQVGDVGVLFNKKARLTVMNTWSPSTGVIFHAVKVENGCIEINSADFLQAEVDVDKRDATRRNHTATHLMHAALREVLGTHVKQAGSVVAPTYLRFDFSHYQPLTKTEIEEIENLVNYHILRNEPVQTDEMAIEEAMHSGAMALFGEKYGEKVRVLSIRGVEDIFSKELCGGTHVRATGDIGVFKITSDESIASGVRRIRAVTGMDAFKRFREDEVLIDQVAGGLKTSRAELATVIGKLQDELKKTRREADELRMKLASGAVGGSAANGGDNDGAREVAGVKVLTHDASGLDSAGMRQLSDTLLARIKSGVVVLGRSGDGKVSLIVRTSDDLTSRVPAGKVIKELAPIVGGKGGGKADMAEGGGALPEKLGEALEASYAVIAGLLG